MIRTMFACLCLAVLGTLPLSAADVQGGARFNVGEGRGWAEGTVSSVGKDGRISIRGTTNPYVTDYATYHSKYYSTPEAERVHFRDGYRDRFNTYTWSDNNLTDYTYTVPNYDSFTVYDDPNYGNDFTTWSYAEPRTYRYSDLHAGDHVVVGFDAKAGHANEIYRVNPHHRK